MTAQRAARFALLRKYCQVATIFIFGAFRFFVSEDLRLLFFLRVPRSSVVLADRPFRLGPFGDLLRAASVLLITDRRHAAFSVASEFSEGLRCPSAVRSGAIHFSFRAREAGRSWRHRFPQVRAPHAAPLAAQPIRVIGLVITECARFFHTTASTLCTTTCRLRQKATVLAPEFMQRLTLVCHEATLMGPLSAVSTKQIRLVQCFVHDAMRAVCSCIRATSE